MSTAFYNKLPEEMKSNLSSEMTEALRDIAPFRMGNFSIVVTTSRNGQLRHGSIRIEEYASFDLAVRAAYDLHLAHILDIPNGTVKKHSSSSKRYIYFKSYRNTWGYLKSSVEAVAYSGGKIIARKTLSLPIKYTADQQLHAYRTVLHWQQLALLLGKAPPPEILEDWRNRRIYEEIKFLGED